MRTYTDTDSTQTQIVIIVHIILYANIRGRHTNLNYFYVRQDPGKAYRSKLHKNTHPVTVVLKETVRKKDTGVPP